MFKSLYLRIAIYTIVVILFSALISFLMTNVYYHFNLKPSNDEKIMKTLKEAKQFQKDMGSNQIHRYFKHLGEMNYQLLVVDNNGKKTFYGEPFRKDSLDQTDIKSVLNGKSYHGIKNKPFEMFVTGFFDNETDNTVGLRFETQSRNYAVFMRPDIGESFSEFRIFLAVLLTLLLLISISLVIASTYSIVKPVKGLKYATERLMNGDFETPIHQTRQDEIGTLQYRFDTMRKSIKQVDDMRQHFVQNVSHEMKTPLTHIHHLLTELQNAKTKEQQQRIINDIYEVTTNVSALIKELLLLSELDNAEHIQLTQNINLSDLIKDMIRHEQYSIETKKLLVISDLNSGYVIGNERLLSQAFSNLIRNAIKYTPVEGIIDIQLNFVDNHVHFNIQNEGKILDKETQHKLFDRFYKVNAQDNSNGLGLAITKSIIELHQGQIEVESSKDLGTIFKVVLPTQLKNES